MNIIIFVFLSLLCKYIKSPLKSNISLTSIKNIITSPRNLMRRERKESNKKTPAIDDLISFEMEEVEQKIPEPLISISGQSNIPINNNPLLIFDKDNNITETNIDKINLTQDINQEIISVPNIEISTLNIEDETYDKNAIEEELLTEMGQLIHNLYLKQEKLKEQRQKEYEEELDQINEKFNQEKIEIEKEYNDKMTRNKIDYIKKADKDNTTYKYDVALLAISVRNQIASMKKEYGEDIITPFATIEEYENDIISENDIKWKIHNTPVTNEDKERLIAYINNYLIHSQKISSDVKKIGYEGLLSRMVYEIGHCTAKHELKYEDLRDYYCGLLRMNEIESKQCLLLRELFAFLSLDDMSSIWSKFKERTLKYFDE